MVFGPSFVPNLEILHERWIRLFKSFKIFAKDPRPYPTLNENRFSVNPRCDLGMTLLRVSWCKSYYQICEQQTWNFVILLQPAVIVT